MLLDVYSRQSPAPCVDALPPLRRDTETVAHIYFSMIPSVHGSFTVQKDVFNIQILNLEIGFGKLDFCKTVAS